MTACLLPAHRWSSQGGRDAELRDEVEAARRSAGAYREETVDITDPRDVSLVIVSHPFWTDIDARQMPVASSHVEIAKQVKALVARSESWDALAAVVLARPT